MNAVVAIAILVLILGSSSSLLLGLASSSGTQSPQADANPNDPLSQSANDPGSAASLSGGDSFVPITSDPSTWPGNDSDPIWACCHAIAFAEGDNVGATAVPARLNNPGDISDGNSTFGSEDHDGSKVTHFPDAATGWQWLYDKVSRAVNKNSSVYFPDMTWNQVAQKWAGNWPAWVKNVTSRLGVSPTDRFGDFFGV